MKPNWLGCLPLVALGAAYSTAAPPPKPSSAYPSGVALCSLVPASTLAVVRVEQDTLLPFAPSGVEPMSFSGVRNGPGDSLLAVPATLMPAARVRLLQLDSSTRATLLTHGIADSQPTAFIRAAPYRADCRTIRWTDSLPFAQRGEVGYVRAKLASREDWVDGIPVLIIPDTWNYPYPRRRGLVFRAPPLAQLTPPEAMFSLNEVLEIPRFLTAEARLRADSVRRARALEWGRANPIVSELEPARTIIRRAVLEPDWREAERVPSRLRGTYRVDIQTGAEQSTWFFRTHDRPGYSWRGPDTLQTTRDLIASPYVNGYLLVGNAGPRNSLSDSVPRGVRIPLVWLASNDRPTAPGNAARHTLSGILEFTMSATPELLWDDLEAFVPRESASDSAIRARFNRPIVRGQKQPRLPLTINLDERGGVHADTTLTVHGRALRVMLRRIDTLSTRRPF